RDLRAARQRLQHRLLAGWGYLVLPHDAGCGGAGVRGFGMTAEKRPDPPVAADVDLRGLEYMPLFGVHLFGSEFNAAATDAEWRAAITLWWAAWNQVPAGSLPKDDVALCRLADLGRDLKLWRKLKARALH